MAARSRPAPNADPANPSEGGDAYVRDPGSGWRRRIDDAPVEDAADLTLGDLFAPPLQEVDGVAVRLVPRVWASRHPDHPLAWTFEHAELGARGPIAVPAREWEARAGDVVAMSSAQLHPWNLVGVDGVAAIIGVAEPTVRAYLARRQMPEPLARIGRTPVWSRGQIEAWQATRTRARRVPPVAG